MAGNVTNAQREERRRDVHRLWSRGLSISQIARATGADWETVRRDCDALAAEAADELDVAGEYHRLLAGAKEAEAQAWMLYSALEKTEGPMAGPLRLGGLSRVLAAQAQVLGVLTALRGARADHQRSELDLTLAEMTGERLPAPVRRRLTAGE